MSTDSQVLLGHFVTGTMAVTEGTEISRECPTDPKHNITHLGDFCPVCGHPIRNKEVPVIVKHSLYDLLYNEECAWNKLVSPADLVWVQKRFSFTEHDDGYDNASTETLIYLPGCVEVNGLDDGFERVDVKQFVRPSKEELRRLEKIMGYTGIIVEFGINVSVSY